MNFKERNTPTVTTKVLLSAVPYIVISKKALIQMFIYVDKCSEEIGWMGTAYRDDKQITIDDVYLFDQEVHSTTTEITPEGLSDFATELLNQENGMDIWNNLKMWGHSHVRMGVTPSAQDDKQMETFQDGGHDWFIRLIANKNGELKIDLYDYVNGIIYNDLPWYAEESEEEEAILAQIRVLQAQLDGINQAYTDFYSGTIEAEMKVKVRKKTYSTGSNWYNNQNRTGYMQQSLPIADKKDEKKTDVKKEEESAKLSVNLTTEDYFENDNDVLTTLSLPELYEVYQCRTFEETEELLTEYGWFDTFTDDDIERIMRVSNKHVPTIYGGSINGKY
jgi:hypothetical protein